MYTYVHALFLRGSVGRAQPLCSYACRTTEFALQRTHVHTYILHSYTCTPLSVSPSGCIHTSLSLCVSVRVCVCVRMCVCLCIHVILHVSAMDHDSTDSCRALQLIDQAVSRLTGLGLDSFRAFVCRTTCHVSMPCQTAHKRERERERGREENKIVHKVQFAYFVADPPTPQHLAARKPPFFEARRDETKHPQARLSFSERYRLFVLFLLLLGSESG